jgi:hypothetical protein
MPSPWHDAITHLVEHDPEIAVTIARDYLGEPIPFGMPAWLASPRFNDRPSTDFDCDAVVVVGSRHNPLRVLAVEAQQAQSEEKRQKLAKYAAELWVMLNCPIDVIVICPDEATCDYYAAPFRTSLPGYIHTALPLNPGRIPVITDAEQMAKDPGRADLILAFHSDIPEVVEAFAKGMDMLGEAGRDYYQYGLGLVTGLPRKRLEELMAGRFYISEWAKKAYAEGLAQGQAEALPRALAVGRTEGRTEGLTAGRIEAVREGITRILELRKLEVTTEERVRILTCHDLVLLRAWHERAVTAKSTAEIF